MVRPRQLFPPGRRRYRQLERARRGHRALESHGEPGHRPSESGAAVGRRVVCHRCGRDRSAPRAATACIWTPTFSPSTGTPFVVDPPGPRAPRLPPAAGPAAAACASSPCSEGPCSYPGGGHGRRPGAAHRLRRRRRPYGLRVRQRSSGHPAPCARQPLRVRGESRRQRGARRWGMTVHPVSIQEMTVGFGGPNSLCLPLVREDL